MVKVVAPIIIILLGVVGRVGLDVEIMVIMALVGMPVRLYTEGQTTGQHQEEMGGREGTKVVRTLIATIVTLLTVILALVVFKIR